MDESLEGDRGQFSSGVTSYFRFLRGLVILNTPLFAVKFAFVTIPQIVYRWNQQKPSGYT